MRAPWDPATVVAVAVMLLVLAMWTLRADAPRAHASAAAVDTRAVDAPLAVVRERWDAEFARLRDQVRALAVHEATYEFARRPNFPYVDDHYGPKALAALGVDTVLIVDAKGRPIFWRRPNDPDNQGFPDAELFLAQLPQLPPPSERAERGRPVFEGIVQFRGVPALVSAIAIEPPTGDGTPRGHLIYGRAIDGVVTRRVLDGAPPGLDVMPASDALLPAEVRIRLDRSLTPLIVTDEQRIRGYLPLIDAQGRLVRVFAASAARPTSPAAAAVADEGRGSWPVVAGSILLLLLIGGGGFWWTSRSSRVVGAPPRSDVERLARVLAAEAQPGATAPTGPVVPGAPQVAVAEALVGLGATADEPPAPEWLHTPATPIARRAEHADPRDVDAPDAIASPDAHAAAPRDALGADGDEHEWLIGTPDDVLQGEHDSVLADALDGPGHGSAAACDGESSAAPLAAAPRSTSDTASFEVQFEPAEVGAGLDAAAPVVAADGLDTGDPTGAGAIEREDAPTGAAADAAAIVPAPAPDSQAAIVRRLLDDGRLRVHYQPQVSTANGTIVGVEALVRWEDDETALRSAGELFGDGTSADSFSGATEFVLRRACADRRDWMRQIGRTLPVSVNVGLAELREPGFVARVLRILEEADLPPAYLEFEVPERALARPGSPETDALEHAYRSGIAIAIGGFVAADAPLRALTQVPVAKLKLHRSLVADLPDDTHARMVVDAVLAIGRTLNVLVCAEGVERPAQAAYLELRQCPLVQGWHYARPMDADQLFALMKGSGVDTVRLPLMDVEELEAHARAAGVV